MKIDDENRYNHEERMAIFSEYSKFLLKVIRQKAVAKRRKIQNITPDELFKPATSPTLATNADQYNVSAFATKISSAIIDQCNTL